MTRYTTTIRLPRPVTREQIILALNKIAGTNIVKRKVSWDGALNALFLGQKGTTQLIIKDTYGQPFFKGGRYQTLVITAHNWEGSLVNLDTPDHRTQIDQFAEALLAELSK